jgi:outer membrane protein assembly factor BamB
MVKVRLVVSIALITFLLVMIGCGGGTGTRLGPDGHKQAVPEASLAFGAQLPLPSALHVASYTPADLLHLGSEYGDTLPQNRVSRSGSECVFAPDWQSPGGQFDGLAYATYQFQLDGFDLDPVLHLTWAQTGAFSDGWVALANFTRDRWDWFPLPSDGALPFDPAKHISGPGVMYVVVLFTGTAEWRLQRVAINAPAGRGDWWMVGREPTHNHRSPFNGPQTGTLAWKFQSTGPGNPFGSPLIAADGTVYVSSSTYVYSFNSTGSVLWKYPLSASLEQPALKDDGTVYVTSTQGALYAISSDGVELWHYDTPDSVFSGASIGAAGDIYFCCDDGLLYAIKPDGALDWSYDAGEAVRGTPLIAADGTLYIYDILGRVVAVNSSGIKQWDYDTTDYIEGNLSRAVDGTVYVSTSDTILALSPAGALQWTYAPGGIVSFTPVTVRPDGRICAGDSAGVCHFLNADGSVYKTYASGAKILGAPGVAPNNKVAFTNDSGKAYLLTSTGMLLWSKDVGPNPTSTPAFDSTGNVYVGGTNRFYVYGSAGLLQWTSDSGGAFVANPVLASDGTIYATCQDSMLYALNPDGTLKWAFEGASGSWAGPALASDGTVLLPTGKKLYALSPAGVKLWEFTAGGNIECGPAIDTEGRIYFGSSDMKVYALDPGGAQVWAYTTTGDVSFCCPAIGADGTVYIGGGYVPVTSDVDGKLYAINHDGTLKWIYQAGGPVWSSPALAADGTIIFGGVDYVIYALNPDGSEKWTYTADDIVQGSAALAEDGTIYIGDTSGNQFALNPDGTLKWKNAFGGASTPCVGADGTVYLIGFSEKAISALDPATGTQKWSFVTGEGGAASPTIAADGTLYCGCTDGYLYAIKDP